MRKTSVLSLLLALAMAVSLLAVPASAASGGPRLVVSSDKEATSQEVGFTGLPDGCQSLQVTFALSEDSTVYAFAADSSVSDIPGVYTTFKQDGANVTVYVTAKSGALTADGALTLGVISTADTPFTVVKASDMKTLDSGLGETTYPTVDENGVTGDVVTTWPVTVNAAAGGKVGVSPSRAPIDMSVTLTVQPQEGYRLESLTAVDASGKALDLRDRGDGRYTFTMPASAVTVTASFRGGEAPAGLPFTDVVSGSWYYDSVAYVYEKGLMGGTGDGLFAPDLITTRGMIVTILYRLAGSPAATAAAGFADVAAGAWYADAVNWANANGIVTGYGDGRFGPEDTITREQMAVILYRYARSLGKDMSAAADLSAYTDAAGIGEYAVEAVGWAAAKGLLTGTDAGALLPSGSATRSQAAALLMRFCENVLK